MLRVALVISDVDGTLVTNDKVLTPAAIAAAQTLRTAGVLFSVTSSRPPFGMRMLREPLGLTLPIGPFNGSSIVDPDLTVQEQHLVPRDVVMRSLALFRRHGIDVWLFTNREWIILRDDGHYVAHEKKTIQTDPTMVEDPTPYCDAICKLVGVSADFALLAKCETELQAEVGVGARAARSQNYYLDVTPDRDKGAFVAAMGQRLKIPMENVATIGDMSNDLPMFRTSGFSFAMGNATDAVKAQASQVTATNLDDGFAKAVARILALNGQT
jgi:Cof subfamily protein (haloacid dehalogenase superfamily)